MSAMPQQIFNPTGCNTPGLGQQVCNFRKAFEAFPKITSHCSYDKQFAARPLAPGATARYLLPRLETFGGYEKAMKIALEILASVHGLKKTSLAETVLREGNIIQKQKTELSYQTLCEQSGDLLIVDVRLVRGLVSERQVSASLHNCEYGLSLLAGIMATLVHPKLFDTLPKSKSGPSRIVFPGTKSVLHSGTKADLTPCLYREPGETRLTLRTAPRDEVRPDFVFALGVYHP